MTPTSRYVHGTHPEEQRRLADLNALVNHASLEALAATPGERALDVGSGLGQFARALARVTGERVVAVERSPEQIARAVALAADAGEEPLVDFRAGDALSLPLARAEWGSFDLAHARFLLEHVPGPQEVVNAMGRAVRTSGGSGSGPSRPVFPRCGVRTFAPTPASATIRTSDGGWGSCSRRRDSSRG